MVAVHDRARDPVRASQGGCRRPYVPGSDQPADHGRRHGVLRTVPTAGRAPGQRLEVHDGHRESELATQLGQQDDIPAGPMTEPEVAADDDVAGTQRPGQDPGCEVLRGLRGELVGERDDQHPTDAHISEQLDPAWEAREHQRGDVGGDDRQGMRVERDGDREQALGAICHHPVEQHAVAPVHAVEGADGHGGGLQTAGHPLGSSPDTHGHRLP